MSGPILLDAIKEAHRSYRKIDMDEALLLFSLRLVGGLILLGFLFALAWIIYLDLQRASLAAVQLPSMQGHVRVLASSIESAGAGTIFPLLSITRIGRAEGNTIVLDDAFVSAEHALLARREGQWWVEDLDSRNGTLLNDLPLEETAVVSAGDVITVGGVKLMIELADVSG